MYYTWLLSSCNKSSVVAAEIIWPAAAAESFQSWPTLYNPIDDSPPGSSVHGIFQTRVLEWVAIAFSDYMAYIA